ncbi:hypothetical protein MKEN_00955000 [Mycena kentingensis (nom. inval.)]|nr:hypothetical protein MKEN_00955000 [Mycena kentingensis (nom. inval.)]
MSSRAVVVDILLKAYRLVPTSLSSSFFVLSMSFIVDDADFSAVKYSTRWRHAGVSSEFMGTTSYPGGAGDSARLTFRGTSVMVFGTIGLESGPGSAMNFTLDGGVPTAYMVPTPSLTVQRHQALFAMQGLDPEAEHILEMVSVAPDSDQSQIFLDYFLLGSTAPGGSEVRFVDDTDGQDGVQYSAAGWEIKSSPEFFGGSAHSTGSQGAWIAIAFRGTAVTVHGSGGFDLDVVATLDGDHSIPMSSAILSNDTNEVLFQSPTLDDREHTLNLSALGSSTQKIIIDYFLIANDTVDAVLAQGTASGAPIPGPSATLSFSARSSTPNLAIIVGAAVGGGVLLLLLLFGAWYLGRRKERFTGRAKLLEITTLTSLGIAGEPSSVAATVVAFPSEASLSTLEKGESLGRRSEDANALATPESASAAEYEIYDPQRPPSYRSS